MTSKSAAGSAGSAGSATERRRRSGPLTSRTWSSWQRWRDRRQSPWVTRASSQLALQATVDGLTGLLNHATFQQRLTSELERASRQHQQRPKAPRSGRLRRTKRPRDPSPRGPSHRPRKTTRQRRLGDTPHTAHHSWYIHSHRWVCHQVTQSCCPLGTVIAWNVCQCGNTSDARCCLVGSMGVDWMTHVWRS